LTSIARATGFAAVDRAVASRCRRVRRSPTRLRLLGLISALFLPMAPGIALSQSQASNGGPSAISTSLGPGDFIVLKIWREPDLSDTVKVDNDGVAVFPKLGPIEVTGIRPDSLDRLLVSRYSQYLQNPSIRVSILRRITIWGAVTRPGPYPVDLTMTIPDALALAGGATSEGKANKVELRRGSSRTVVDLSGGTRRVGDLSLRSGDQLFVPQRSWLGRNAGLVVATLGTVTSLVWLIARN
jgi:protein involved in polysaccharide export with SLBB domain